jgi:hypothetical protein
VAYGDCKDNKFIVLNGADNAVVAYAVAPLAAAISRESLAVLTGIFAADQIFVNPEDLIL